ncbi:MAG: phage tail assembly protein [Alphaproteobacteria bacterium]|nr:phage tail assembly protein [Alphaproteobacteria bacterium]MDD9919781.1 phage tail assembly protein [Alphaproteobacteria bacterium]
MAEHTVELQDGIKVGGSTVKTVSIKQLTAGDIFSASAESEVPVPKLNGELELVVSPTEVGKRMLCAAVVKVGDIPGKMAVSQLETLSLSDFQTLQTAVDKLNDTNPKDLEKRGRDHPAE